MAKYKGKKILVVGFGMTGVAVTKFMVKQGARVTVTDIRSRTELSNSVDQCEDLKIEYDLGRHTSKFFVEADLIIVSPGVPLSIKPLEEARMAGVEITSEVEIAARGLKEPLIAVTGTNGKTTTTTLLGEMFKTEGRRTFVGGNIGNPLINHLAEGTVGEGVVAELSSFQLEAIDKLVPATAVFTNIERDHLDRYPNYEAYVKAKHRLLEVCDRNSYVVLNYDDPELWKFAGETNGRVIWFTKQDPMALGGQFAEQFTGAYYIPGSGKIIARLTGTEEVYDLSKLRLLGDHNKENLMAAICAARAMGIARDSIQKVIDTFPGVPHRLEFVRKRDGVYIFNDSKSTNVASLKRSLEAFKRNQIILISGGKDKETDFTPLGPLIEQKCKLLILVGESKEKINRSIGDLAETYLVGTFEEAVLLSYQKSRNGDIILLSPGCASFDMFRNYEERGDYFKKLINQI